MSEELAASDRRRLDRLMRLPDDPALGIADPEAYPGADVPSWAVGLSDAGSGVRITVWWVADPADRSEASRLLMAQGDAEIGTNGAMLFAGRVAAGAHEAARARLRQLASRFGGEE